MNSVCERFLGSVRRECLDHLIILSDLHLRHVLTEYALSYFNTARPHQGIGQQTPVPTQRVRAPFTGSVTAVPVLGGLSSARTPQESAALFFGEEVVDSGAVGVSFEGVEMIPCVSQGAAPLGRELTITGGQGNVITELAGRPALETIRTVIDELSPRESALISGGLLIGIVIDTGRPALISLSNCEKLNELFAYSV